MAQASSPSTLGGQGGWIMRSRDGDHPGQHGETSSLKIQKNTKLQKNTKNTKISWMWWRMPVVTATLEAEAGELA